MEVYKSNFMINQIFKSIPNYEGYYEVSNLGNVRSVDRITVNKKGVIKKYKGRILTLHNDADGYKLASISKDGKTLLMKVHRLVAMAFINNVNNYDQVNHINGIKNDNRVENLEWCNMSMNRTHAYRILKIGHPRGMKGRSGLLSPTSMPIYYTDNTGVENVLFGAGEIKRKLNIPYWRTYEMIKSGKQWNGFSFYRKVDNSNDIPLQDGTI